jgi:hypothetical protein
MRPRGRATAFRELLDGSRRASSLHVRRQGSHRTFNAVPGIIIAASPEERQNVMQEARKEMQDSMAMMKPMMHGGAMAGSGMMARKGKPAAGNAQTQMLEKRMDMMQMMMQMMMDQQGMTMAPSK